MQTTFQLFRKQIYTITIVVFYHIILDADVFMIILSFLICF